MPKTIDTRFIRYINLLEKISRIRTKHCFIYNNCVVFVVPKSSVSVAIGEAGKNVKKLCKILNKKIKIVFEPSSIEDVENFTAAIVSPARFKDVKIEDDTLMIFAGSRQNRAALIGRNKARLLELKRIIKAYFNKDLKIV